MGKSWSGRRSPALAGLAALLLQAALAGAPGDAAPPGARPWPPPRPGAAAPVERPWPPPRPPDAVPDAAQSTAVQLGGNILW